VVVTTDQNLAVLLEDRVAVVSGIGPGIGRDVAITFAREGAHVALGARREERLREVAAEVEGLGRKAVWASVDITNADACHSLAEAALRDFGRIDVLVNNAFLQPPFREIEEESPEGWREAFEVNVVGSINMTKACLPAMKDQRAGSVVFVNTMSIRTAEARLGAYAASKSALLTAAQTLAREVGEFGIRVNSVVPGYVWGPSLKYYFKMLAKQSGRTPEEIYESVAAETCLRHIPTSAEIADAVLFFASDLSHAITGQSLDVNAGHWLH
jgi:NAD(P)-dependent dehydrogenase (short-subunit alcohol dehydrogenase family)